MQLVVVVPTVTVWAQWAVPASAAKVAVQTQRLPELLIQVPGVAAAMA